jgi:triacylglycerol lipase
MNVVTASAAQCIVASVDYRLAPETRAPGSVEDCYAALRWIHANAESLGADPSKIAIGGESAGGGLTAALALLARDRAEVPIIFQMLLSPMLDDRTCASTDVDASVGEFVWTQAQNIFGWQSLLGCEPGMDGVSPYCAPGRADDLSRLPPAYVAVGALDLFRDEAIDYARRLLRAGVPTELHVFAGAYHGFERAAGAAIVQRAEAERREALRRALHAV